MLDINCTQFVPVWPFDLFSVWVVLECFYEPSDALGGLWQPQQEVGLAITMHWQPMKTGCWLWRVARGQQVKVRFKVTWDHLGSRTLLLWLCRGCRHRGNFSLLMCVNNLCYFYLLYSGPPLWPTSPPPGSAVTHWLHHTCSKTRRNSKHRCQRCCCRVVRVFCSSG